LEITFFDIYEKMETWYGEFFLGNSTFLGRKHSKIWALWRNVRFLYNSINESVENGCREAWGFICKAWEILSGEMENII